MYSFSAKLWRYSADNTSWFFVTLPREITEAVKQTKKKHTGWGQVPVEVTVGTSIWRTSLFPSKKRGYILAIIKSVRHKEKIEEHDKVHVSLQLK